MRQVNTRLLTLVVLLLLLAAPAVAAQVKYSVHDTGTEFEAGTLNGLTVAGDRVTAAPETYTESDINANAKSTWSQHGDTGSWDTGSPMWYDRPQSQSLGHYLRYDGVETNGRTGTMSIRGDMETYDYDDGNRPHSGYVMVEPDGDYYLMVMRDADDYSGGAWQLGKGTLGSGSVNWMGARFGDYYDFGGFIDAEMTYDHDTHTLCGYVYGPDDVSGSRCVDTNGNPTKFGVTTTSGGKDFSEWKNTNIEGHIDTGGTYTSKAHNIDAPSQALVDIGSLSGGDATVTVRDGNGNSLGSATYSSPGTKTIALSSGSQVGSEAYLDLDVTDTGDPGMSFDMYEESLYFDNDPPGWQNQMPADGTTIHTEHPKMNLTAVDPQFDEVQGDEITVTFYTDKDGEVTTKGPFTQDSFTEIYYDGRSYSDGDHWWYVEITDSYGATYTAPKQYFTISHHEPVLDGTTASPDGVTSDSAEQVLSINASDSDFDVDGDTLTTDWYLNGTNVATTTHGSDGEMSYTTDALEDGDYQWHVEVSDEWGNSVTSSTYYFTIEHGPTTISNLSPNKTVAYETNTFSADISDPDFENEGGGGDSVDVRFYLEGSLEHSETITGSQTVDTDIGPLDDGSYNWYVETEDKYGYVNTSDTQTVTIQHSAPSLSSASPTGTTHYENNELSVDLADGDYGVDGDSVDLEFIVDGAVVDTQNAQSAGTYNYTAGPLSEGSHTWRVNASDDYGYSDTTGALSLDVSHDAPNISNPSPDGTTNYEENTLQVDVGDLDFRRDGDSVDVEFFVDGASQGTATLSSNGTASLTVGPFADGSHDWHVEWSDDYGYTGSSATWSLDIEHAPPAVDSMSDPGSTNRENVPVSVEVSDDDFIRDGDNITVKWYVDGVHTNTTSVVSAGTTSATFAGMADGSHSWSVRLEDDYGHATDSSVQQFDVHHYAPSPNSSTMEPADGTVLKNYSTVFSINVSDVDFDDPTAGETVDATLVVSGEEQATTSLSSNGTASVEVVAGYGGEVEYYWTFEDKYGYTAESARRNITSPGNLTIYNELNPSQRISTGEGEAVFYFSYEDGTDNAETRNITDDTVDMGGLPTDESFVVVARADGYYNRRVWVESLFKSDRMYVLPDGADVVQQSFELQDYTGDFPLDQTVLEVQKSINGSWETIDGDYFGADDKLNSILAYNDRHRLVIRNVQTNETRELGTFFPVASGTVELRVFDDRENIYQANVPNIYYEPDIDALPSSNGTAVTVGLDPRESGVTNYTVVASLEDGTELYNRTLNDTEEASMSLNLSGHRGEQLKINTSYTSDDGPNYVVRRYDLGRHWSENGLVGGVTGFVSELGSDLAGLVAVLVSGLLVAFTAPYIGPRASGTVATMGIGAFALLGYIQVAWFAVTAAAYLVLLGRRWRP